MRLRKLAIPLPWAQGVGRSNRPAPTINLPHSLLPVCLHAIPPKPPRSKLEPYCELIRDLRWRSKTYREIARIWEAHVGLHVKHSTMYE